jgi:branched-chain amino acid transport system permease protein
MEYLLHILVLVAVFAILAVSLDLLAGHAGLLSIAHAAFYGLGAYTSALLCVKHGASFLVGLLAGIVVAGVASLLVSLPSVRLSGDYFVVATFAFQMITFSIFNNWMGLTNGPLGISGIPRPVVLGWGIRSSIGFLALAVVIAAFSYLVVCRISRSPFGRVLHAIREDELFAQALGKDAARAKVLAFVVSAALASSAGSLYAHYTTYIDPTSFTVTESILVISMVIIGGAGSPWGPLVGAVVLVTMPEALRFIGLPSSAAANLRQMFYGALLVIMMMFRPRGLVGRYGLGR